MKIKVEIDTGELSKQAAAKVRAGAAALQSAGRLVGRATERTLTVLLVLFGIALFVAYWYGAAFLVHAAMEEKDSMSRWSMFIGGGVALVMLTIVAVKVLRLAYARHKR